VTTPLAAGVPGRAAATGIPDAEFQDLIRAALLA
jgi:hypothetical protein